MTTQPEALRLADKMNSYSLRSGYAWHCHKAAAELRRLHESNQELLAALQAFVKTDAPDQIKSSTRSSPCGNQQSRRTTP